MTRNVYLILAEVFLMTAGQTMMTVLVPLSAASMGTSEGRIGLLIAIPGLMALLAGFPCAALSDRIGRRRLLISGATLTVGAALVFSLAEAYGWLMLGMAVAGLSNSVFFLPALAYVSEVVSSEVHVRVQGYNGGLQGLAALMGVLLAGVLIDTVGFSWAFVAAGLLGLLTVLAALRTEETVRSPSDGFVFWGEIISGYRRAGTILFTRPQVQMAVVIGILHSTAITSVGDAFFPLFATTRLAHSSTIASSLLGVRNLAATATSLLFGAIATRFGMLRALFVGQALESLGLLLLPWAPNLAVTGGLLAAQGIGLGLCPATANVLVADGTSSDERGLGFACVGVTWRVAAVVVAPLLGLLAERAGLYLVFVAGGAFAAMGMVTLVFLQHRRRDGK
jgi:MFS family permease